jgi:hypothetical protein
VSVRSLPRIAVYGQAGSPYHYISVFTRHGYDVATVFAEEIRSGALAAFDAFVIPGGAYDGMISQIEPLGQSGAAAVSEFVRSGGMYIGSCAGAYDAADPAPDFRRRCPAQAFMRLLPSHVWNEDREHWRGLESPGVGRIRVCNDFPAHPIMAGLPAEFEIVHYNGPIFIQGTSLLSIAGSTEEFTPSEDFFGQAHGRVRMIEQAAQKSLSVVITGEFGDGRVLLFGCHPEFGFSLGPMDDEQLGTRMLVNALEWQHGTGRSPKVVQSLPALYSSTAKKLSDPKRQVEAAVDLIRMEISKLSHKATDCLWLSHEYAMSVFGKPPSVVWETTITAISKLIDEVQVTAPDLPPAILNFEPPAEWRVDVGYAGVVPLLSHAGAMLAQANELWNAAPGPPSADPYAFIRTSPYHLVAGSYLAAIGRITGAALLCRCPPGRLNV